MKPNYKLSIIVVLLSITLILFAYYSNKKKHPSSKMTRTEFFSFLHKSKSDEIIKIELYSLKDGNFNELKKMFEFRYDIEKYTESIKHSIPWHPNRPALRHLAGVIVRLKNNNVMVMKCYLKAEYDAQYEIDKETVLCRPANQKTFSDFVSLSNNLIDVYRFKSKNLFGWFAENQVYELY